MKPVLSIVIANYNYGRFLPDALDSIFSQCGDPVLEEGRAVLPIQGISEVIEIIICDAGSSDNSVEIIRKNENKIAWWCSETDKGQSDAFNKGFLQARGRFLTWLNSDEIYTRGTFIAFVDHIRKRPDARWITANDYAFSDASYRIKYICWGPHYQPLFFKGANAASVAFGPSSFMDREVIEKVGLFDVDVHYGMDTIYWRRMALAGYSQSRLNRFCWGFRTHDRSKTAGVQSVTVVERRQYEQELVRLRYGGMYEYSFKNPWYVLWMVCRLLDGSLFVNLFWRIYLRGKDCRTILKGKLWK